MLWPVTNPDYDPDTDGEEETFEAEESGLTLEALHEELIATTTEARRGNRRTLDVLKNFGAVLDALSATANATHKAVRAIPLAAASQGAAGDGSVPRDFAIMLVDLGDRLDRVIAGFARPPGGIRSWWPGARKSQALWSEAWAMQADALAILRSHLGILLKQSGLERLEVVGRPFDPHTMSAIESAVDPDKPDHTVLAEILPGWRFADSGQLVRPAQVKVSRLSAN